MNSVDRVKAICKERKIAISRLEKDLGYANGYIGQLRKGVLPDDRLVEIARYLAVTTNCLLGTEKTPSESGEGDIPYAKYREVLAGAGIRILLDADAKVSEDQIEDIVDFIRYQQQKYGR